MTYRILPLLFAVALQSAAPSVFAQTPAGTMPQSVRINVQNDTPAVGDFTVGPARLLLTMKPGEERNVEIQITNREGRRAAFDLTTEDFVADQEREGTPTFFADDTEGPYPARAWITPQVPRLELNHAERAFVNVTIKVPNDAEAGDHQAALIVTRDVESQPEGGFTIVSRVAAMFIITVEGDIVQEGYVDSLESRRYFNWFYPAFLRLSSRNLGTVHMIPTGSIEIRNIFGIVVDEIPVKNWVVLRDSSRARTFEWHPRFALGYYRASTDLTVFDGRPLQPVSAGFWMIPLLPLLLLLFLIFLVSFLVQYFFSRFEIKRKGDEEPEAAEEKPKPVKTPKKRSS
jgi:hypothetical protein